MVKHRHYKSITKWRKVWRKQKRRYYAKSQIYTIGRRPWTDEEDARVLKHDIVDNELSKEIYRSVAAIQKRRCMLNKIHSEPEKQ